VLRMEPKGEGLLARGIKKGGGVISRGLAWPGSYEVARGKIAMAVVGEDQRPKFLIILRGGGLEWDAAGSWQGGG